jgi:hypothetical protein
VSDDHAGLAAGTSSGAPTPDTAVVERAIESALCMRVKLLSVERSPYSSTARAEVVVCQCADGTCHRLFCKHGPGSIGADCWRKRGVPYEAEVYRRILTGSPCPVPRCYGSYQDVSKGETWLVLELLEGPRLTHQWDWEVLLMKTAAWIGRFHGWVQGRAPATCLWREGSGRTGTHGTDAELIRYDRAYYEGWTRRTWERCGRDSGPEAPLVRQVCEIFLQRTASLLLAAPETVIHGECYAENVMIQDGGPCLIDWESAAIGPGEIDLASLIEGWPAEAAQAATDAYCSARWPDGRPDNLEQVMDAARVYQFLLWRGSGEKWSLEPLRPALQRLGML